jgi:hypothetical protein
MKPNRSPDFGAELRRPFEVHECCYDCVEFYGGCNAWPAGKPFACADYHQLPDVLPGTTGQMFPPSRMKGRKEPRARSGPATPGKPAPIAEKDEEAESGSEGPAPTITQAAHVEAQGEQSPKQTRRPSPVACHGLNGEHLCECGAVLPKRKRCCDACRLKRRDEAIRRWHRSQQHSVAASDDGSTLPLARPGRASTLAALACDN